MVGGHALQGDMHFRRYAWWEACMVGGIHGRGAYVACTLPGQNDRRV